MSGASLAISRETRPEHLEAEMREIGAAARAAAAKLALASAEAKERALRATAAALRHGKSLLPAGLVAVEGEFERGDAVLVRAADGSPVAKGLVAYDAADARRLAGRRTDEIEAALGWRGRDELIHRDDLVLL